MLRLRPYRKSDAEYIVTWIKDEVTFRKWSAYRFDSYLITGEDVNKLYDNYALLYDFIPMTAFDDDKPSGHLFMRFTDSDKKELRFGFVIVDNAKRGMGYGKELLTLSLQYAFELLMAQKVTLGVFENNRPAYCCYRSVGFKDTGERENYHILQEDWKCLELEISR